MKRYTYIVSLIGAAIFLLVFLYKIFTVDNIDGKFYCDFAGLALGTAVPVLFIIQIIKCYFEARYKQAIILAVTTGYFLCLIIKEYMKVLII
ncbi:hypothetical protein M2138_001953 [Dysgonomonadaceae bacterium PH5-43]|nr:hypothetical protein [Dysgonomonadaceae bacterium PH5-43]